MITGILPLPAIRYADDRAISIKESRIEKVTAIFVLRNLFHYQVNYSLMFLTGSMIEIKDIQKMEAKIKQESCKQTQQNNYATPYEQLTL